ncbi:GntR family transcriptional regulator [Aeromicrobium sp. CFBP 8757]|uniref:GntR family transcriptional regulator n=1 Tax=Aeromicrobium sp. CFBP 8757 TaxID=2775288 RepID=UPI00177E8BB1|nr:GntR family transcriptional regulator [Aeromicrobium sp. CFBP 8757]MBD8607261.1 GntR family transcriptional regulator [Aeromicrobium sp. CFBP 8757]
MTRTTTADRVFASLRESIVTGEFPAGSLHSIYRLADLLEVSRTPVREAVLRLADIGLVTIERNRGVRIRGVTVDDVRAVFELRLMLEVPAAALAAARADAPTVATISAELEHMRAHAAADDEPRFTEHDRALHQSIAGVLGNARLQAEIATLRDSIQSRGASTIRRSRGMVELAAEHAPIVEAIALRDPEAAAAHMEAHLVRTATLLMEQVGGVAVDGRRWSASLRDHLYVPGRSATPLPSAQ